MPNYTIPLWRIIELTGGKVERDDAISVMVGGDIGLNKYDIFNETFRPTLNGMFIDRYYNREIGTETLDMFTHAVRRRANEIMPLYNKLFLSLEIEFDPMKTVDLRTLSTSETEANSTASNSSDSTTVNENKSKSVNYQMPGQELRPEGDYATAAVVVDGSGEATAEATDESVSQTEGTSNDDTTVVGYQGNPSDNIMRYRESLINVIPAWLDEFEDCFMQSWDTNDSYNNDYYWTRGR